MKLLVHVSVELVVQFVTNFMSAAVANFVLQVVQYLHEQGANPSLPTGDGWVPMFAAALAGDVLFVSLP